MQTHVSEKVNTNLRRGIATLEFAMAMPIVLTMFALLMWLGFSVIGQAEVTIAARQKTWKQRFDDKAQQPLIFPTAEGFYELKKDFAVDKATKTINVSPMFSRMPNPESAATVLAGSWDHRALPLNEAPNWKQHGIVLANSYTGTLQQLVGQLGGDPLDFIVGAAGNFAQGRNDSTNAMNNSGGGSNSGGTGGGSTGGVPGGGGIGQGAEQQKQQTEAQRREEIRLKRAERDRIRAELFELVGSPLNPLDGELGEAREEYRLAQLSDDPNETPEERKKRIDRLEAKVDLLTIKSDRLEMQLDDVEDDLDALG